MITAEEIKEAAALALKARTKAKIYKNEVIEGFLTPCFFVTSYINGIQAAGKNTVKVEATVEISYFASKSGEKRVRDESDAYKVMGALSSIFSVKLKTKDRFLNINDNSFAWVGENSDIPVFQFVLEYFDDAEESENESVNELIEEIKIRERIEN